MNLDRLFVYCIEVDPSGKSETPIEGGEVSVTQQVREIFEQPFLGTEKRRPKYQPFHFNFSGEGRTNQMREHLLLLMSDKEDEKSSTCELLARKLQKLIDDRVGDLLFTIGLGWDEHSMRCALWVYPSDTPLVFNAHDGQPEISQIEQAFTKKSQFRKAVFFNCPVEVGVTDLLKGDLIDSTRSRLNGTAAVYWVERFLFGHVELTSNRGTRYLIKALTLAQKHAQNFNEKTSVTSALESLVAGVRASTTLERFGNLLIGKAKTTYLGALPKSTERNAEFDLDLSEIKKKFLSKVYVLDTGVQVIYPVEAALDPENDITETERGQLLHVEGIIEETFVRSEVAR